MVQTLLAVLRVGNGGAELTDLATAAFVDLYVPGTGELLQMVALPMEASGQNMPLTLAGNAALAGLSTSADGRCLGSGEAARRVLP